MADSEEIEVDQAVPLFPTMEQVWGEETVKQDEEAKEAASTEDDVAFLKEFTDGPREKEEPRQTEGPRRRGRPPGSRNRPLETEGPRNTVSVPKNARQLEREISERGQYILMGATGLLGNIRPAIAMHDDEARAIAEPLASYLRKRAEESEAAAAVITDIVERWDVIAVTLAVMGYITRVWRDDIEYRKQLAGQAAINSSGAKVSRRRGNVPSDGIPTGEVQNEQRPEDSSISSGENAPNGRGDYGPIRVPNVPGV